MTTKTTKAQDQAKTMVIIHGTLISSPSYSNHLTTMTSIISMMTISMKSTGASRTGTVKREFRLDAIGRTSLKGDLLCRIIS
jgi:hypothetical protein